MSSNKRPLKQLKLGFEQLKMLSPDSKNLRSSPRKNADLPSTSSKQDIGEPSTSGSKKSPPKKKNISFEQNSEKASQEILSENDDMVSDSPTFLEDDAGMSQLTFDQNSTNTIQWHGIPLEKIDRMHIPLATLSPSTYHTLLIAPHIDSRRAPRPYPSSYQDRWDNSHIRMPCSPENLYPVESNNSKKKLQNRWNMIENSLNRSINSSIDLEEAILTYNDRFSNLWTFGALHRLVTEEFSTAEVTRLFGKTIPAIVKLALNLPNFVTKAIPRLQKDQPASITMSQQQAASLLANAFLCTFPRRNSRGSRAEFSNYPSINFNSLFALPQQPGHNSRLGRDEARRKMEKLRCFLHYFDRVTESPPVGTLTYSRRCVDTYDVAVPNWATSRATFSFHCHVTSTGNIEDDGAGMLQADFANRIIGGGVMGLGCVQEEIRFCICPELVLSRLFTERIQDNETVLIEGAERFSTYSGYADSFVWTGNYDEASSGNTRDDWGRWRTSVTAIDASVFRSYWDQFKQKALLRELKKAYCGFSDAPFPSRPLPKTVATGNWGCGAFGGDHCLKALLQMMVCAEAGKELVYFTFGDADLAQDIHRIHTLLKDTQTTVSAVWKLILAYREKAVELDYKLQLNIFQYLEDCLPPLSLTSSLVKDEGETLETLHDTDSPEDMFD